MSLNPATITLRILGTTRLPLETATYISDLVASNPAASDGLNNADDHMRLIKGALQATFPSITGPITATQAQLNAAALLPVNGLGVLADTGAFFKTNNTDGFTNPVAGEIDLKLSGTIAATFARVSSVNTFTWNGPATFTGAINGPGITPIGGMIMWLTDVLPTTGGTWCWANGGTLSRTGNGALLFAQTGTFYGAGDGSTTFNVINMQEAVPVGKSTMGGASSPGLLASIASGVKTVIGAIFGSDTSTLITANLPAYTPSGSVSAASGSFTVPALRYSISGGTGAGVILWGSGGLGLDFAEGLTMGGQSFSGTPQGGSSTAFNNTGPSRVVNFIIRIG